MNQFDDARFKEIKDKLDKEAEASKKKYDENKKKIEQAKVQQGKDEKIALIATGAFTTVALGATTAILFGMAKKRKAILNWYADKHNIPKISEFTKKVYKSKAFENADNHGDEIKGRLKENLTPNKVYMFEKNGKKAFALMMDVSYSYGYDTTTVTTDYKFYMYDKSLSEYKSYYYCAALTSIGRSCNEVSRWFNEQSKEFKKDKKEGNDVKESVDTKLNIYEAFNTGYITEEEKIQLLDLVDEVTFD